MQWGGPENKSVDKGNAIRRESILIYGLERWFSTWDRDPQRGRVPFLDGPWVDIYVHCCITFAFFEL